MLRPVEVYRRIRRVCCPHYQGSIPEDNDLHLFSVFFYIKLFSSNKDLWLESLIVYVADKAQVQSTQPSLVIGYSVTLY